MSLSPPEHLPDLIRTDESNAFAHNTVYVRLPAIVGQILDLNPDYPGTIRRALESLRESMIYDQPITMLEDLAPDYEQWLPLWQAHKGHTWLNTDWWFAENFFYRRVIQATRWLETGRDPFLPIKKQEYASAQLWELLETGLNLSGPLDEQLNALLHLDLWGNRIDLSFEASLKRGTIVGQDDLLVDRSVDAVRQILDGEGTVHLITDNAGTELTMDLVLIDFLLHRRIVDRVVVHLKGHPTFVSDATMPDIWRFLDMLDERDGAIFALGERLRAAIMDGRLRLAPNPYWNRTGFLWEIPEQMVRVMKDARLVIVKGDANYRRTVGDAFWPAETPYEAATAFFPAPLLSLRTLKCDVIVGLPQGKAEELDGIDSTWRSNGQRGLIQFKQ